MVKKKDIPQYSHAALVRIASKWLFCSVGCQAVAAPGNIMLQEEIPDAIGWNYSGKSVLIEVKVSRPDFLADADKSFRKKPETGMGLWRYYMTPRNLLKPEDIPAGWGWLEVDSAGRVFKRKKGTHQLRNLKEEMRLMMGCLRRIQAEAGRPVWKFGIDTSVYISCQGMAMEPGPETIVEPI